MNDELMDVEYSNVIRRKKGSIEYRGVGFFASFDDMKMVAGKLRKEHGMRLLCRRRGVANIKFLLMVDNERWDETNALIDKYAERNVDHNWVSKEKYQY